MCPLVFVIVLNWNGKRHLEDCLGSLSSVDYGNHRVILVDNGSRDGSVTFVRSRHPKVHIICNGRNLGFAEGNNVGIRYALSSGADYVVLLNNDTRVEPDFLTHLVMRGEENPHVGVLGATVLMFSNPLFVNSTGVCLNRFAHGWDRDFGENLADVKREAGDVLAVTGCVMAVKRQVFERIGLLDASFFAYYEDVDFCIRVWKHTDYTVEYVPGSVVYHKFSGSTSAESPLKRRLMMRNQYRIFFGHFPPHALLGLFPRFTVRRAGVILYRLWCGHVRTAVQEAFLLAGYWLLLPLILMRRMAEHRGERGERFWHKVIPGTAPPSFKPCPVGYERVVTQKECLTDEGIPSRIIMGVNDEIIGTGWSSLLQEYPRVRKITARARCYLKNESRFGFLQVHGLWDTPGVDALLDVSIEGKRVGSMTLAPGWRTYVVPFENGFPERVIEVEFAMLHAHGPGAFAINETGLFSLGSPALRWMTR